MNIPFRVQAKIRSPRRLFNFRFATLLIGVGLSLALLLPVIKNLTGNHHPMPSGQLKADMRTLIFAVRYLLDSEPAVQNNPVPFVSLPTPAAQGTVETYVGAHTNQPAQI